MNDVVPGSGQLPKFATTAVFPSVDFNVPHLFVDVNGDATLDM
jgi:hypothetical protein